MTPLYVVAVCHRLPPIRFIERLHAQVARGGRALRGVAVANQAAHALDSPVSEVVVIRGSNDHLDFSGYFEGLARLLQTEPSARECNVLFVNDSLFLKHAGNTVLRYLLRLDRLIDSIAVAAISGKLDPYRSVCLRNPWSGHAGYVTTFCFLLNRHAQPLLSRLLADAQAAGVLDPAPLDDRAWAAGIDPVLREQIRAHLVYRDSPYRWIAADDRDIELARKKARCVYFEQRLSGAIGTGGALVPINAGPRSRLAIGFAEGMARIAASARRVLQ